MKRKLLFITLVLLLCLALCSCGGDEPEQQGGTELQPIGTAAPVPEQSASPVPSETVENGDEPVSNENGDPQSSPAPSDKPMPSDEPVSESSEPAGTPIIPLKPQISSSGNLVVN